MINERHISSLAWQRQANTCRVNCAIALGAMRLHCRCMFSAPVLAAIAWAVILGGAGLAGMAALVQPQVTVPVIDSVVAGATWALRAHPVPPERKVPGFDVEWAGVSGEMTALGHA